MAVSQTHVLSPKPHNKRQKQHNSQLPHLFSLAHHYFFVLLSQISGISNTQGKNDEYEIYYTLYT